MIPSGQQTFPDPIYREISAAGDRRIADFRHQNRQSLHISEVAARSKGIEPQQYQVLLAIKGLPEGSRPTVRTLSGRRCLRHHSTVELIDRLVEQRAVTRLHSDQDRREVLVELTPHGEEILHQLSLLLWQELRVSGSALSESLMAVVAHSAGSGRSPRGTASPKQPA